MVQPPSHMGIPRRRCGPAGPLPRVRGTATRPCNCRAFPPTEPIEDVLRRTGLLHIQAHFDDQQEPELYHPAALTAVDHSPQSPLKQIKGWHLYANGTHQTDTTRDAWAVVIVAEDVQRFSLQGLWLPKPPTRRGIDRDRGKATSTTSELAALARAHACICAHCRRGPNDATYNGAHRLDGGARPGPGTKPIPT